MERYSEYKDSGVKWLGEIPSHWEPSRNKAIFRETKAVVGKYSKNFTLLSLTKKGVIVRNLDDGGKFPAEFDTYKIVEPGDFIFCFFDVDETPRAIGLSANKGMITGAYTVLKQNTANSRYLYYYYLSIDNAKALKPLYSGLRKTVPLTSFMSMQIFLPPKEEQDAIVRYLDAATSKIDKAIDMQQKMIDLLNERKQIIIQNAVTKGLDDKVEMKDSGVEWIGMIPKHWEIKRLKYVMHSYGRIGFRGYGTDDIVDEGQGAITLSPSNIQDSSMDYSKKTYLSWKKYYESPEIMIKNGDVLMVKTGSSYGKCAVVKDLPMECTINPQLVVFKEHKEFSEFLAYSFQTTFAKCFINTSVIGGTIPTISQEKINNYIFPFPSKSEQQAIVAYLDKEMQRFDSAITNCQRQIALLQERKQIIINEVVTGKVKVS